MAKFIFVIVALSSILIDCNSQKSNSTEQTGAQNGNISAPTLNLQSPDNTTTSSTVKPTTSTTPTPPTPIPTSPSPNPPHPTISPSTSTTVAPSPAPKPTPEHDRSFDLPSFIGGVILSLGLAAIGYVVFKFYKTRTDPNYRTI